MFFRRRQETAITFAGQLERLRSAGFEVRTTGAGALVSRANLAADLREEAGGGPRIADVGILIGGELALLTDIGFQKIFRTPGGRRTPALAEHLTALHAFREEVVEALGLESLYNESLGTTNEQHLYDRVAGRDRGAARRPWQRN